jgi:hypothetical protein
MAGHSSLLFGLATNLATLPLTYWFCMLSESDWESTKPLLVEVVVPSYRQCGQRGKPFPTSGATPEPPFWPILAAFGQSCVTGTAAPLVTQNRSNRPRPPSESHSQRLWNPVFTPERACMRLFFAAVCVGSRCFHHLCSIPMAALLIILLQNLQNHQTN